MGCFIFDVYSRSMLGSVVFGYLVILSFVTARIIVTVSKDRYNVQAGDDVTLECSIYSDDGPLDYVYWEKDSWFVYRSDSGTGKKYSGSSTADPSLTIHSTTTGDSGNYYCFGRKGSSRGGSDWIYLRVIEVIVPSMTYSVQTGTSVTLQCSISPSEGVTTVYWTKEGPSRQVYSSDSPPDTKYYTARNNPSLTISNTVVEDTGRYTCRALLSSGHYSSSPINVTSSHIHLTVYKPFTASIRPDSTDITVQEGQRVTARTCEADGCPSGCVTEWTLPNGGRKTSDIFTRPVTREQAGMYTCTASIGDDRHSESFSVTVNYGPKTISLFPPGDVTVHEGDRIDVRCQASCSPSCDIYWTGPNTYKDGKRGANQSIGSADKADRGVYVCTASNDYGNISTSLRVNVNFPPEVLRKDLLNTSYIVDMWDSVVSSISVDASPLPEADLVHAGYNQQEATKVELTFQRQPDVYRTKYSFSIRNITYSDVGHYTLTVSNSQGNFTYRFSINFTHEVASSPDREKNDSAGAKNCQLSSTEFGPVIAGVSSVALLFLVTSALFVYVLRQRIAAKRQKQEEHYSSIDPAGREVPNTYEMIVTDQTPP